MMQMRKYADITGVPTSEQESLVFFAADGHSLVEYSVAA